MTRLRMFLLGMREFRALITTNPGQHEHAYDSGRDLAHRLTARRFEP